MAWYDHDVRGLTEWEWLTSTDPAVMLNHLIRAHKVSDRRLRLFTVACCWPIWHLLGDERSRTAVEVAERFADGLATRDDFARASETSWDACIESKFRRFEELGILAETKLEDRVAMTALCPTYDRIHDFDDHAIPTIPPDDRATHVDFYEPPIDAEQQVGLLRDIFANPFRPEPFEPAWLSPDATALARTIYLDRAFDRMPILGDALEEAGCDNLAILDHCRSPTVHVRGCWVVDAVLGRSAPGT